nr:recombination regulator RecX [Nocardia cyriacigeorgica]
MRQQLARLGVEVTESTGSRPEGRQPAPVRPSDGGSAEANARGTRSDASDPQRTRSTEFPGTRGGRNRRSSDERHPSDIGVDGFRAAGRRRRRGAERLRFALDDDDLPMAQDEPSDQPGAGADHGGPGDRGHRHPSNGERPWAPPAGNSQELSAPKRKRSARGARAGSSVDSGPGPTGAEPGGTVEQAKDACLRLLAVRARSRAELAQRLAAKGYPAEVSEQALDRLAEVGLIDDAAFAQQWVRSRHTYSGKGRQALAQELRRKGVSQDDAAPALAAVTTDDEHERATELVRRKLRTMPANLDRDKAIRRLVGMLARRGYNSATAYAVVKAELDTAGSDFDPEAPHE